MEQVNPSHLERLCPELKGLLNAELAAGNRIYSTGGGWPKPETVIIVMAQSFKVRPATLPADVIYREVNDPHWWKDEYVYEPTGHVLAAQYCEEGNLMSESKDQPDDLYDLAPTPAVPEPQAAIPIENEPRERALNYRARAADRAVKAEPEKIKNFYMPIWLLSAGVLIETVAAFLHHRDAARALISVGVELILGTLVMLVGILIAAKVRHIDLGDFWTAIFKLSAVAVAPTPAVVTLIKPVLNVLPSLPIASIIAISLGGIIGLIVEFILYFALLGVFFDLDESDTWYCVWTIFLVNLGIYFAVYFTGLR